MVISNKYKDTLDDLIDSSDMESLNQLDFPDRSGLIDKGLGYASRSRDNSLTLLEDNQLDEDVSVTLLELVPNV